MNDDNDDDDDAGVRRSSHQGKAFCLKILILANIRTVEITIPRDFDLVAGRSDSLWSGICHRIRVGGAETLFEPAK